MFTQIKTSKANKMIVTDLSRKFNLGAENTIARIAIAYSLSKGEKMNLANISDSQGKEYSKKCAIRFKLSILQLVSYA